MLYIFLSFLVCLIIFIIDRILITNIPTAPSYLEAYFYFTYLLIFALCYILFSKLDSTKLSNRGAMTAAIKVTKAVSFVKNPTVYSYMESSKNINERIINKLVNKRTFFTLVFLGLILLLVSLMFSMKYWLFNRCYNDNFNDINHVTCIYYTNNGPCNTNSIL